MYPISVQEPTLHGEHGWVIDSNFLFLQDLLNSNAWEPKEPQERRKYGKKNDEMF